MPPSRQAGSAIRSDSRSAPEPPARRGTCAVCGKGVFSDQPRSQENGAYVHDSCQQGKGKKRGDGRGHAEQTIQVANGSKTGAKDESNGRTMRGTCAVCSTGVFSDQPRSNENGKYYHEECLKQNAEPKSPSAKVVPNAKKALSSADKGASRGTPDPGADAPSHRGDCAVCGQGVYSNQARSQEGGKYFHDDCLANKSASETQQTTPSAATGTAAANKSRARTPSMAEHDVPAITSPSQRGTCQVCGQGVYSNQARSQENGSYFHEECLSQIKAKSAAADARVTPKTPVAAVDDIRKEEPRSATVSPSVLFSGDDADAAKARADIQAMMRELETKSAVQASRKAELAASRLRELSTDALGSASASNEMEAAYIMEEEKQEAEMKNRRADIQAMMQKLETKSPAQAGRRSELAASRHRQIEERTAKGSAAGSNKMETARILEEQKKTAEMENRRQEEELRREAERKIREIALRDKTAAEIREQAKREEAARVVVDAEARLRDALVKQQQELARREEAVTSREARILQQEQNLQQLKEASEREVADARQKIEHARRQARCSAAEAPCGPDRLQHDSTEPLANSVLEWLQNIEPETSDVLKRLAKYHSDRNTTQEAKGWIDDVSELLSMWLQTGDMFRQLATRRASITRASKNNVLNSQEDRGRLAAASVDGHAASCAARLQESALGERCRQVCAVLHHRTAHTASMLPSLKELVLLAERASRVDHMLSRSSDFAHGMSSFVAQFEYELHTVALERAEFEEAMSTMAQVADAWKTERLELRNVILQSEGRSPARAVLSPMCNRVSLPLLSSEATIAQLEMWYKELALANLDGTPAHASAPVCAPNREYRDAPAYAPENGAKRKELPPANPNEALAHAGTPLHSSMCTPLNHEKARAARLFVAEDMLYDFPHHKASPRRNSEAKMSGHGAWRVSTGAAERSPMAESHGSQTSCLNATFDRGSVGARASWLSPLTWEPNRMTDMGLMPELEVHQSRDHEDVKIRDYEDVKTARCRLI